MYSTDRNIEIMIFDFNKNKAIATTALECKSPSKKHFNFALILIKKNGILEYNVIERLTGQVIGRGNKLDKAINDATYTLSVHSATDLYNQIQRAYNINWEIMHSLNANVLDELDKLEILYG